MQAADLPENEHQRLAALHALQVLDTPAEEAFDRLTQLACDLFDLPVALVSLVDAERQWFKSHQGLTTSETCRDLSFCAHAVAQNKMLIIEDTLDDQPLRTTPWLQDRRTFAFMLGSRCSYQKACR